MSDTAAVAATEATPAAEVAVVDVSPTEVAAREQGWVSKDEWVAGGRDEGEWRPAKEFVERGELFKSIHTTKRELKQTQAALTALQKHHQFVFEKAHQKAVEDLKREKRQAIRNEDFEALEAIEEKMESLTKEHQEARQAQAQTQQAIQAAGGGALHPDFAIWQTRNTWYTADAEMREFADATGIVYANRNPGIEPAAVLKHVETTVRKRFPEKFGPQKTAAPNPTTSVDRQKTRGTTKADDLELDDTERQIMATLVKTGVMTEAEYKAELKKVKGA